MTKHILIVDDEPRMRRFVRMNLELEGFQVSEASDGLEAIRKVRDEMPALVVLDVEMPHLDGFETLAEIRRTFPVPVIMLTVRGEEEERIKGLDLGADDYVTKPFSVKVLMQRIRALLSRRYKAGDDEDLLDLHGIRIDRVGHQAYRDGCALPLTPTEYRLLEAMMRHPGRAFTRNDLLSAAVGCDTIVLERTIDVHIRSLRQKLGDAAAAIETVRGVGYRLARELPV